MSGIGGGTSEFKNEIAKLSDQLSRSVARQVERRAKIWLEQVKGARWTDKFEHMVRENAKLREALTAIVDHISPWRERGWHSYPTQLRDIAVILLGDIKSERAREALGRK